MKIRRILFLTIVVLFCITTLAYSAAAAGKTYLFGDPVQGLAPEELTAFNEGFTAFSHTMTVDEGLGPVFNGRSCAGCHRTPVTGGGGNRFVTRFGTLTAGVFDPLSQFGGQVMQDRAIGPADGSPHQFNPDAVPPEAAFVSLRRTQPLFGLGLVEAVPDQTFIDLAKKQSTGHHGIAGQVNMVLNPVTGETEAGKFGWKAQISTLEVFSGDGLINELGITNPIFPQESCPAGDCTELVFNPRPDLNDNGEMVQALTEYQQMLGPPPRGAITAGVKAGESVFANIGCAGCHQPTLRSGYSPVAALDHETFHPYSDFLLHDVGTGDGIVQAQAGGAEFRTAPLWGLRMINRYMHDGRALTLEEAIQAHGGQAAYARDAYNRLGAPNKAKLLEFLNSL